MQPSARRPCIALVLAVLLGAAAPARADDAATAREHYQKGTSYYDLGRYADAIKEFEAAYEIKNDPALLYNLAQSNRLAGNSEQALHFYRTYLRYVPKAANRAEIEDRIKQLDQLVTQKNASQTTPPNATPPGGTEPPPNGTPPVITPPGVTTPPPETPPVLGAPPPPPDSANTPPMVTTTPPAAPNNHHGMLLAGKITAAAGAGLLIIGAAFGQQAVGAANEVNNEAAQGKPFDPSVEQRGKSAQTAEAWFLTLGALAAATGGVLYFYGRHLASQERASITPVASSDGAGMSLRVTF
jgi:tetratricopeptide (TPR) repeat protein